MESFSIHTEYIELIGLLKAIGWANTGGHAKILVEDELVKVNGEIELRKRKKLRTGDQVEFDGQFVQILDEKS
ncbi:MAG: RNA-binding S4 domain-containing protein [Flavobacteriales bacterium]